MMAKTKTTDDIHARVKARLLAALKAADDDASIEDKGAVGVLIDGWFQLDQVVDAVIAEVRR
jgi:hypothetical protein